MIKSIFFDAFDTLFAVEKGASENMVLSALHRQGIIPDATAFHAEWKSFYRKASLSRPFRTERCIFANRIRAIANSYHISLPADEWAEKALFAASIRTPFPDVFPVLSTLKEKYQLFIASNTDQNVLDALLQRFPLPVDAVFTSESLRCYKPAKEFYLKLLAQTGYRPNEILFVGDSFAEDVAGPKAIGMHSVLLSRNKAAAGHPFISSLTKLPEYLISLL